MENISTLSEFIKDAIILADLNYEVISWNKGAERMYGYKEVEVKGRKVRDIFQTEFRKQDEEKWQIDLRKNGWWHGMVSHKRKDGVRIDVDASIAMVKNEAGNEIAFVAINRDVSEAVKERDLELDNSRSFLRQLIDSSVEYVAVLDKDLNFLLINKRYEDALKVTSDWAKGKNLLTTLPYIKDTIQHQSMLRALQGETVYLDKRPGINLTSLYVDTYYIPLILQGKIEGVIVMSRDITEMVKTELLLAEKNAELQETIERIRSQEQKDKQKDNFIQMASHELKTPVTSIKGYVQFLLSLVKEKEKKDISLPQLESTLESVDKQLSRLTKLITDLLDLTKIDRGRLEMEKEVFNISELVEEIVNDFRFNSPAHHFHLENRAPVTIMADKDRIRQVMENLLSNAVKYSPRETDIFLSVDAVEGGVRVKVSDKGIGIDKNDQQRIFERFYRADSKDARTFPGFGIGLFIASEIISLHGGKIEVDSDEGKGSTFIFYLPSGDTR